MKQYDYILITTEHDKHHLQIGEIINMVLYPDGDVKSYIVKFANGDIVEYNYKLEDICKVLLFK